MKSCFVWREFIALWGFGGVVNAGLSGDRKVVFGEVVEEAGVGLRDWLSSDAWEAQCLWAVLVE